jgi:predicted ABC-type ATPase
MADASRSPVCTVIAGPNGAGKTIFALRYLPEIADCRTFVNADLIAAGLSPLAPGAAQAEAARLFLREIRQNVTARRDFAFETTLAGRTHARLLRELRSQGWRIVLLFLWVPSAEFSAGRVAERVAQGGHDVPLTDLRRRFPRTAANLLSVYADLCDDVLCLDNSGGTPRPVFRQSRGRTEILDVARYQQLLECLQ